LIARDASVRPRDLLVFSEARLLEEIAAEDHLVFERQLNAAVVP
jgi:hypothetical protein